MHVEYIVYERAKYLQTVFNIKLLLCRKCLSCLKKEPKNPSFPLFTFFLLLIPLNITVSILKLIWITSLELTAD